MGSIQKDDRVNIYKNGKKTNKVEIKVNKSLSIDDFSLLKQAAVDGIGVATLPTYMCREELKKKKLVQILPEWGILPVDVYAMYPKYRSKIKKVNVFLDFLTETFLEKLKDE